MSPILRMLMRQNSRPRRGVDSGPLPASWKWTFLLALVLLAGGFASLLWFSR